MADLKLRFACGSYDRIEPLRDGSVQAEGIDLDVVTIDDPRELFDRMMGRDEFDVAEMSSAEQFAMASRSESPFIALPVFTSRCFRHSFMCVNAKAGINAPKDLEGKRIGVPLYSMSAAIWCRGLLRDDYGVDLSDVTWIEGSMDHPGSHGQPKQHALSKATRIETNLSDRSLSELLATGEIDATIGALMPTNFGSDKNVLRLFPDFRATERNYYIRTGVHPIMHLVVIRKTIYEREPWIAQPLFTAFGRAKRKALDRMFYTGAPKTMLPFLHAEVEETRAIFGDDPWPDGVAANRRTLECAVRYMLEDGLIETPPDPANVFADVSEL